MKLFSWFRKALEEPQDVPLKIESVPRPDFKKRVFKVDIVKKPFPIYKGKLCVRFNSGIIETYEVESKLKPIRRSFYKYENVNSEAKFYHEGTDSYIEYSDYWVEQALSKYDRNYSYNSSEHYVVNVEINKDILNDYSDYNRMSISRIASETKGHNLTAKLVENYWIEWETEPCRTEEISITENIKWDLVDLNA